ncbi:MAG: carbohydrate kinase, partial [Treponema sp.]|nr:carbohydrate kinase [Treponema sp.]
MIVGCGEALIDMVPRVISGKEGYLSCPGGSPYNTIIAVSRIGAEAAFLGRLSRDFFGDTLVQRLADHGVDCSLIRRSDERSTLAFVKLEEGREPQYSFYIEGTADRSFAPEDLPRTAIPNLRCLVFGSISMTMEPVASTVEAFLHREAQRADPPVISLDPNIRPFMIANHGAYVQRFETWLPLSTIVKISQADFDFIYPGLSLDAAMERVLDQGPSLVLSTQGANGALALLRRPNGSKLRMTAPVIEVPVVDTIGAGDSFHGAFLAWLDLRGKLSRSALTALTGQELYEALCFANKAASLVCSRQGAEPPTLAELEELSRG